MIDSKIQEVTEAIQDRGHRFRAVAEGLAYLWKRGKLSELGEALADIRAELLRDVADKHAARELFVRLLTKATTGAPGTMAPDDLEDLKVTCPELSEIAEGWAARRLSKNERDHFAAMWPKVHKMLVGYARKYLKNSDDAMDCVADTAAYMLTPKVFRVLKGDRSATAFRKFATHCCRYNIGYRLEQRKQVHFPEQLQVGPKEELEADPIHRVFFRKPSRKRPLSRRESSVVNRLLNFERNQAVHQCLDELPARRRKVAWHSMAMGETINRTVELTGLTYKIVTTEKRKARDELKERIPAWVRPELRETFEETVLRLYYKGDSSHRIATRLGCSRPHVCDILRRHDLETDRRATRSRSWTPEEDDLLRTLSPPEAARETGRTLRAIYVRRGVIGVPDGRNIH